MTLPPSYICSISTLQHQSIQVLSYVQVLPSIDIFNYEPFLVRQMQQANKTVACADVRHLLSRVHMLQVVHDTHEFESASFIFCEWRYGCTGGSLRLCGAVDRTRQ